jgi:hypothetical protein
LQPQLNKACKSTEKRECGDVNPKDFIIFAKDAFSVEKMWKVRLSNLPQDLLVLSFCALF